MNTILETECILHFEFYVALKRFGERNWWIVSALKTSRFLVLFLFCFVFHFWSRAGRQSTATLHGPNVDCVC